MSEPATPERPADRDPWEPSAGSWTAVAVSWVLVGIPLAWGIWKTLQKAAVLFR